ncbi:MAG: 50S ribosomal protein L23 [Candidatus Eutrophobiaceae bacterium]
MSSDRLMNIIQAPLVTEKSELIGKYVFRVVSDASKREIKLAVELLFEGIQVKRVCVCNVKGKRVLRQRIPGRRASWKKAYVSLQKGQSIKELRE